MRTLIFINQFVKMSIYPIKKYPISSIIKNLIKIDLWLTQTKSVIFILFFVLTSVSLSYFFLLVAFLTNQPEAFNRVDLDHLNTQESFWLIVLFAPLFETFIFQFSIIKLLKFLFNNYYFGIIISAILFGINHSFSVLYIINATLLGILFGYVFVLSIRRNGFPFWTVFLIHALVNFLAFVENNY